MAGNLTASSIKASITHNSTQTVNSLIALSSGSIQQSYSLNPATTVVNSVDPITYTLAASGTQSIDLANYIDAVGATVTSATKVVGILLTVASGGGDVTIAPGASNGLVWFFGGTSPTHTVKAGGCLLHAEATGTTVDSTHKTLTLTNLSGSLTAVVTVVILLKA